jgi:hypothetical protein
MYLNANFEKFARTHNVEVGCLLLCRYEGDGDMSVGVFDDSSYCMPYRNDNSDGGSHGQL